MFEGVPVHNFPVSFEEGGDEVYPLDSGIVVRDMAKKIPEEIRPAVIIDYEKIPRSFFDKEKAKLSRSMSDAELENAEAELVRAIFDNSRKRDRK